MATGMDRQRSAAARGVLHGRRLLLSDPSIPDGLTGKPALIQYLSKLLTNNPDWTWTHTGSLPLEDGFLNKWRLDAPVGDRVIICRGFCTVQLRGKLIYRNEVYFDMSRLAGAIQEWGKISLEG
jgi:hypothetical protein